ncbi:LysR family transcriptional regulator [Sorangium sp. So ce302]|uniref:hypothetical protein n=1 Tax=Sorangium sp. So ce302 TaxID=3133297 RepID=UPI003F641976
MSTSLSEMSLPQLRCFVAVVDAGSFAEADQRIGMSTSSVLIGFRNARTGLLRPWRFRARDADADPSTGREHLASTYPALEEHCRSARGA